MTIRHSAKGSWGVRFFIGLLGVILGVLLFWLLSFIENDIGRIKQPDRFQVRRQYVSETLDDELAVLKKQIDTLNRRIQTLTEQQRLLSGSTSSLQNTISQLLSIQKESLARNVEFSEKSKQTLQDSQAAFLDNQEKFQQLNREISDLTSELRGKEDARDSIAEQIRLAESAANEAFQTLYRRYQFRVAALKLAFLVPVFLAASFLFLKYRSGPYWALVWAAMLASFIKLALVAHRYFPSEYFKYIALLAVIAIVLRFLVVLVRMIIAPKPALLIRQYQQHYDKCLCPVCSKPIRSGPLRFIGALGKRTPLLSGQADPALSQQPYSCPSCGTRLYEKCQECGRIRHSLLPYCEHCGDNKNPETIHSNE